MASADGSHVHCVPFETGGGQLCPCGIVTATPQTFTVTSRPNPTNPVQEFPVADGCAPQTSPYPPSLGLAHNLRSFTHWFLSSTSVSRLPDPPHSVVLDRPGFVGAASHPSRRLPSQAAPSYNGLRCDVADPKSFHLRYGTQRLVAHRGLCVDGDLHCWTPIRCLVDVALFYILVGILATFSRVVLDFIRVCYVGAVFAFHDVFYQAPHHRCGVAAPTLSLLLSGVISTARIGRNDVAHPPCPGFSSYFLSTRTTANRR